MADTAVHLSKAETHSSTSDIVERDDKAGHVGAEGAASRSTSKHALDHDHEAAASHAANANPAYPAALAKKMLIMDIRQIVWFFIILLLSFFWRSNLGSGALAAITPDLELPTTDYDKGIAVFFITFILWTIPSILIQERLIKARYWISFNMLMLGGAQIGMGWVTNAGHIWAVRFFLGIGEAGILGGLIVFMMHWYTVYQTAFRVSAFFGLGTLIGSMSGVLAFLLNLVLNNASGRYGWQWILTTVGTVTFIVGVLSFIIIPEYPHSAPGLTAEGKDLVSEAVAVSRGDEEHDESIVSALKGGFTSIDAWLFTATSIALMIPLYCFYSYSPTIVSRLMEGRISVRIQLTVIVPVYIIGTISNFVCGWMSDKLRNRSMFIMGGCALAVIGHFFLLISKQTVAVDYVACILVCVGLYTSLPLLLVWGIENHRGPLRRAVVAGMMLSFSQIGGVVSRYIFDTASGPAYAKGFGVSLALTALTGAMAFGIASYHKRLNARLPHALTI